MKYIVVQNKQTNVETIFLFNNEIAHSSFYESIELLRTTGSFWDRMYSNLLSAGFVDIKSQTCYGRSESLDIDSRPQDSQLLKNFLNS